MPLVIMLSTSTYVLSNVYKPHHNKLSYILELGTDTLVVATTTDNLLFFSKWLQCVTSGNCYLVNFVWEVDTKLVLRTLTLYIYNLWQPLRPCGNKYSISDESGLTKLFFLFCYKEIHADRFKKAKQNVLIK